MGTFNIISEETIVKRYCFEGRWDEDDTVHGCPSPCGQINYIDKNGNPQTIYGISKQSGIVYIEAQSITSALGVVPVDCDIPV